MKIPNDFIHSSSRRIEATEELEAVAWAENNGWVVRKMQYIGRRGCPDRFFFGYGKIVLIEFKKKGGSKSEGQVAEHARMAEVGVTIHTFYSSADAIAFLRTKM
jgi:hypothetical protein